MRARGSIHLYHKDSHHMIHTLKQFVWGKPASKILLNRKVIFGGFTLTFVSTLNLT